MMEKIRFRIRRASLDDNNLHAGSHAPCKGARMVTREEEPLIAKIDDDGYPNEDTYWMMEFDSLEKLMDFIKSNKRVIIQIMSDFPVLTIYDDYVE